MLRLRLSVRSEYIVNQAFAGVEAFERYLNEHPAWMYLQKDAVEWVNGKAVRYPPAMILVSGSIKAIMSLPVAEGRGAFYNRIITIKNPRRDDRVDALAGAEVKEPIKVDGNTLKGQTSAPRTTPTEPSKPVPPSVAAPTTTATIAPPEPSSAGKKVISCRELQKQNDRQRFIITPTCPECRSPLVPQRGVYCQSCGQLLPPDLAVHQEVVVSIKIEDYKKLAKYLFHKVNRALGALMQGRKLERVITGMGQRILLVTIQDEMRTSTVVQEEMLNDLLLETGIGRVSSDIYEVKQAHEMMDSEDSMAVP